MNLAASVLADYLPIGQHWPQIMSICQHHLVFGRRAR